ncbi:roadblock/LC7 domain-containing protein [Streptomyces sp. SBT349]|uniref:roadblock/LC7 domain-containing protein n=1 Tax=Streptomyces sp. SBT349 TaxID=1580539 RepID=UPI001F37AFA2|nr:roadblock/LC7 domain-containing protein [Streptomyces sp. SBT349]
MIVSVDGLLLYWTGLEHAGPVTKREEVAEHRAAIVSGMATLADEAARQDRAGAALRTLIEGEDGWLVLGRAGANSYLALSANKGADVGALGYQLSLLAGQLGGQLDAARRLSASRYQAPEEGSP